MHKRAFTIIELLVVVAIISLLMALLTPALTRAKQLAKAAVCMSNLKQVGLTQTMYAAEARNWNFVGYQGIGTDWDKSLLGWSGHSMFHNPGLLDSDDVLRCPMEVTETHPGIYGWNQETYNSGEAPTTWVWNSAGTRKYYFMQVTMLPRALPWIADTRYSIGYIVNKGGDWILGSQSPSWDQDGWVDNGWRRGIWLGHGGQANILFSDGSVAAHGQSSLESIGVTRMLLEDYTEIQP